VFCRDEMKHLDVPFYDEERIKTGTPLTVRPSSARAILESDMGKEATQARRWKQPGLGRSLSKKDSEFAREMLMFPLSIKNPQVRAFPSIVHTPSIIQCALLETFNFGIVFICHLHIHVALPP